MHTLDASIKLPDNLHDLITSFSQNNAVLFAGAGVSISAQLPSWNTFIDKLLNELEIEYPNSSFKKAKELAKRGDYILAAELIKEEAGRKLSDEIERTFSTRKEPGPIHKELARIPFSFAITTNYDPLLEKAYKAENESFNWQKIGDFFKYIKKNKFAILKLHGDSLIGDSHIMAKKDYNKFMGNFLINPVLSSFFSYRTFIFLGYSLQDPNIIKLLEEGKSIFKDYFGPHYIFLYKSEIDPPYVRFLKNNYNLIVIESDDIKNPNKTDAMASFIRYIGGKSASISYNRKETTLINSNKFDFNNIIRNRLEELVTVTGSDRIYLAFTGLTKRRTTPSIEYIYPMEKGNDNFLGKKTLTVTEAEKHCPYFDLVHLLFYRFGPDPNFLYIPDSSSVENWDSSENLTSIICKETYSSIWALKNQKRSILMVQLFLDGTCVGVLWVESDITDAYTNDHLRILQSGAYIIASIFRKLELRLIEIKRINFKDNTRSFIDLMNKNRDISALNLRYLLYKIDYRNGKLVAHYHPDHFKDRSGEFSYNFDSESFAGYILSTNKKHFIENIPEKNENKKPGSVIFSERGIKEFNIPIGGSLFGTPIRVGKYTSFVLVVWSLNKDKKENPTTLTSYETEAIDRTASLIANSPYKEEDLDGGNPFVEVSDWIDIVNREVDKLLSGNKTIKIRKEYDRQIFINSCLELLVLAGLQRVRLYVYIEEAGKFLCISSLSTPEATLDGQVQKDFYGSYTTDNLEKGRRQIVADANDEYCQFTIKRFLENPYAMHQHRSMFKELDDNTPFLDKDKEGRWIVCPMVMEKRGKTTLVGFISADNHVKSSLNNDTLKEKKSSELEDYFQRYALDVISNFLYRTVHATLCRNKSELLEKTKKAEAAKHSFIKK